MEEKTFRSLHVLRGLGYDVSEKERIRDEQEETGGDQEGEITLFERNLKKD